jgi:DNA-directed RNA polymerase subunit K/omega
MIHRSAESNAFEFVMVAVLRSAQLKRGCRPRVPASHRSILTAQLEIAAGKVHADVRGIDPALPAMTRERLEPLIARGDRR